LIDDVLSGMILGQNFESAAQVYQHLNQQVHVLTLQSGEPGPFASCIAAIDMAVHDLLARRAKQPLWAFLGGKKTSVPVYASGINPDQPEVTVARLRREGYGFFKLKVGFGSSLDLRNIRSVLGGLGEDESLAIDANQGWDTTTALAMFEQIKDTRLAWIEEPLRADRPLSEWAQLSRASTHPLAAGENYQSEATFTAAINSQNINIFQPDIAKWGGFSGCLKVAKSAITAGFRYFPHYLGGGIGLVASAHLLSAAGGDGRLEVDCNPNPLRSDLLAGMLDHPAQGFVFTKEPGLGFTPDLNALRQYQTHCQQREAP